MEFDPHPLDHRGRLWALALAWGGILLLAAFWLLHQPFSIGTYVGGLLIGVGAVAWGVVLYRLWAISRLRYRVDRNGLHIPWGATTFVLPMRSITDVHPPGTLPLRLARAWWRWPAPYVGQWTIDGRPLYVFATRPFAAMWFLCSPNACVGITPKDGDALLAALDRRRRLGPTRELPMEWVYPRLIRFSLWQDTTALTALISGALLLLLLWGEVAIRTPMIGVLQVARVVTLLLLGDILLGAFFYTRERVLALTLWWTGVFIVATFLVHLWVGA